MRARGACTKSPSVRACVGLAPCFLPRAGRRARSQGQGRGGVSLELGSQWDRKRGSMAPAPRPEHGRFQRPRRGASCYSMTRQRGKCCEKYLKSSGVAPGQLVSSSSSSSCSCTRPDSPVVVSNGQPVAGQKLRATVDGACARGQERVALGREPCEGAAKLWVKFALGWTLFRGG